jgi:hypothetical protein
MRSPESPNSLLARRFIRKRNDDVWTATSPSRWGDNDSVVVTITYAGSRRDVWVTVIATSTNGPRSDANLVRELVQGARPAAVPR